MKNSPHLFLLLIATALSLSAPMLEAKQKYQPVIVALAPDEITVRTGGGAGLKVTIDGDVQTPSNIKIYRVTTSTVVTIDGLPGVYGQLQKGMAATVVADLDPKVASSITANTLGKRLAAPPRVAGQNNANTNTIIGTRVLSVTANKITIAHPGSKASAYEITTSTIIKVNGAPARSGDIREGMSVIVASDGLKASSISAQDSPR